MHLRIGKSREWNDLKLSYELGMNLKLNLQWLMWCISLSEEQVALLFQELVAEQQLWTCRTLPRHCHVLKCCLDWVLINSTTTACRKRLQTSKKCLSLLQLVDRTRRHHVCVISRGTNTRPRFSRPERRIQTTQPPAEPSSSVPSMLLTTSRPTGAGTTIPAPSPKLLVNWANSQQWRTHDGPCVSLQGK